MADKNSVSEVNNPVTPTTATPATSSAGSTGAGPKFRLDDANLRSSYSNFVNVNSTREETVLLFGMHQAWTANQKEVQVQLTDRIIMSPYAAKRLATLLNRVIQEHENRFGLLGEKAEA